MAFTQRIDHTTITIQTPELELAFSLDDGGLRLLRRSGGPNVIGYGVTRPTLDLQAGVEGTWLADRVFVRYLRHTVEKRGAAVEITIVIGIGPLMVYDRYRVTGTLIARRISVQNVSEDEIQLRRVRLTLPWARIGELESCRFEAPGNSIRPHVPLSVAAQQRRTLLPRTYFAPGIREGRAFEPAPTHAHGLLALHDPISNEALLCWYYSEIEPAQPQLEGNDSAVTLIHEIELADRLRADIPIHGGTQYILLLREPWAAALAAYQHTLPLTGAHTNTQPAAWTRDATIYETHPSEFSGFAGLAGALDGLRTLGINTICLLPVWQFDNPSGEVWNGNWYDSGNLYAITDFAQLDSTLGTPDDFRALVAQAHALGLRVLVDLPLWGSAASAPYVHEHPDWFCYDEAGRPVVVAGNEGIYSFQWANSELVEYIVGVARTHAHTYDLDGYRVLPARNAPPDWSANTSTHASAGVMDVLRCLERLRVSLQEIKPDAALFSSLGGPAYAMRADLVTDELAHHQFVHMGLDRITPIELGEWLSNVEGTSLSSSARVCFTENHYTRLLNPIANGLRGSLISGALLAGIVLCGFAPSIAYGQEASNTALLARLLHARASYPALRYGQTFYNRIAVDHPQVFAVFRKTPEQQIIGVINVGPHKRAVTLRLPLGLMDLDFDAYTLCDVFTGTLWSEAGCETWSQAELGTLRLTLEPFGAYALLIQVALPIDDSRSQTHVDALAVSDL